MESRKPKSVKIKKCSLACLTGLIILLASCGVEINSNAPYTITNSYIVMDKVDGLHRYAGAYIDLVNNSEKVITSADLSFLLFDSSGNAISFFANQIPSINLNLMPGEETEIIISLDDVLMSNLDASYKLDFVHLTKINYEDGSFWLDPLGVTAKW